MGSGFKTLDNSVADLTLTLTITSINILPSSSHPLPLFSPVWINITLDWFDTHVTITVAS